MNPWSWEPHPEVWFLVAVILGTGWWAVRVIGPKVVSKGQLVVTVTQRRIFILAVILLFVSADWPMHDIAEDHLYSIHMLQHLLLTFVVPPLFLKSIPVWLIQLLVLEGGFGARFLRRLTHPVFAGGIFNALIAVTHWGAVVRLSSDSGIFHYGIHVAIFVSALLMWMPVVSPLDDLRLSPPGQMVYLFLMSIIPTVPAAWLTFADGTVYTSYDDGYELWSISVRSDQQMAGLIMKLLGGAYLWSIIIFKFFAFSHKHQSTQRLRPASGSQPINRDITRNPVRASD